MPLHGSRETYQIRNVSSNDAESCRLAWQVIQLAGRKIIENGDVIHGSHSEETIYRVASNEAGAAGDKGSHVSLL